MKQISRRGWGKKARRMMERMAGLPLWLRRLGDYGLALLFVAGAGTLRWALPDALGPTPFLAFYLAWVGAAAFGGFGPGMLAVVASWLCVDLLFDPGNILIDFANPATLDRLAVLLAGGLTVSLVAERMRRGRARERLQAREVALAKQEWERTFDAVPDFIAIIDPQHRILRANRAMAECLRTDPSQCPGMACYHAVHNRNEPPTYCPHIQTLADGQEHTTETFEERLGGHFLITCTPLLDQQGRTVGSVHVAHDITQRKQMEEALREEKAISESTIASLPGSFYLFDSQGRLLKWNRNLERISGYTTEEISRMHPLDFFADQDKELIERTIQEVFAAGHATVEAELVSKDGHKTPYFFTGLATTLGGIRCVIGTGVDITERKQAEERLRESEARYRCLFENMLDGYAYCRMLFDEQGRPADFVYLDVNDAFERLTGLRDVIGKKVSEVIPGLQAAHPELLEIYARVALTGQPERLEIELKPLDMWLSISVYSPAQGYFTAIFENITARKRAEAALRELNAMLESKVVQRTKELEHRATQLQKLTLELAETEDRERQRLAEILHDDLQQMLAAAKFHLSLLKSRARQDAAVQATATQIDHMLKDAIEKSRSLSHELSPAVLHHGDLAETFGWLAEQVRVKHGLTVRVDARGIVKTQSDAVKAFLYRAAQELLFNVVKHAGVKEARVRVRRLGRYICLSVSDRGRGFDPQEIRETAGFGLLSIQERVALLGGRMKTRSAAGQGSTILLVVPDNQPAEDSEQTPEDGRKTEEGASSSVLRPPSSVLRVLLVDDHEVVRQGVASLLGEEPGVRIVGEATNGREAVALASELRPDVVVMDVSMPQMNGDEATRRIKRELPRTRVVALSMHEQGEMIENMRRAGADSYVLKTAPSEELLAAIRGRQADE